ncbi:MAG: ABC transporter ATP-binding protein [Flavobacteriales bacterium]
MLRELGLVLNAGEPVALLGVNGIGKSTLLHTLTGALPALQGEVLLKGETLSRLHPRERAKRVSTCSPNGLVRRCRTCARWWRWAASRTDARGRLTSEDERVVDQAGAQAGVADLAGRDLAHLSDGERQLVMVARALAQDTPLLLLDEPTAFLDVVNRARCWRCYANWPMVGAVCCSVRMMWPRPCGWPTGSSIAHADGTVCGTVVEAGIGALESAFGTALSGRRSPAA